MLAQINPLCPPLLGDGRRRRGASPLCTPRWVTVLKQAFIPLFRREGFQGVADEGFGQPPVPSLLGANKGIEGHPQFPRQECLLHLFHTSSFITRTEGHPQTPGSVPPHRLNVIPRRATLRRGRETQRSYAALHPRSCDNRKPQERESGRKAGFSPAQRTD